MKRFNVFVWVTGFFLLGLGLSAAVLVGGITGYLLADEFDTPQAEMLAQPIENVVAVPEMEMDTPAVLEPQSNAPSTTDQLVPAGDIAAAVDVSLPAVVTVLSQGARGSGSGSGFFIDQQGYLVTNYHVVEGSQNLQVVYAQGGAAPAMLIGAAPEFDLAVLRVDGIVPGTIGWGDSSALPLGADVIAIGSALGQYQNTVTAGVLSGFNRELGGLRGLLQTDAAINSGNSGGPLINTAGQVIGINTAVVRGGMTNAQGLGFAIPSNIARNVVAALIETGDATPPFLGIQYQELNPQLVLEAGLGVNHGALIDEVGRNTPAGRAGLLAGDVIVAIEGQAIDDRHPLVSLLMEHVAGQEVTVDILRDGQRLQTNVTLGERG